MPPVVTRENSKYALIKKNAQIISPDFLSDQIEILAWKSKQIPKPDHWLYCAVNPELQTSAIIKDFPEVVQLNLTHKGWLVLRWIRTKCRVEYEHCRPEPEEYLSSAPIINAAFLSLMSLTFRDFYWDTWYR